MQWTADSARGTLAFTGEIGPDQVARMSDIVRSVLPDGFGAIDLRGVTSLSPAAARALDELVAALRASGHAVEVVDGRDRAADGAPVTPTDASGGADGSSAPGPVRNAQDEAKHRLAAAFDEVGSVLAADGAGLDVLLDRTVRVAVATIDSADSASLTLVTGRGRARTPAYSDELARRVDGLQYEVGEGPCLDVATTTAPAAGSGDIAHSSLWPVFGPRAAAEGVGAVLAVGLTHGQERLAGGPPYGALNLYSVREYAFTESDRDTAILLASFAGVAIAAASGSAEAADLHRAIETRDVIGQAKGILMARHGLDSEMAFDVLRRASSHLNVKLRRVAEHVAEHGGLAGLPGGDPADT